MLPLRDVSRDVPAERQTGPEPGAWSCLSVPCPTPLKPGCWDPSGQPGAARFRVVTGPLMSHHAQALRRGLEVSDLPAARSPAGPRAVLLCSCRRDGLPLAG